MPFSKTVPSFYLLHHCYCCQVAHNFPHGWRNVAALYRSYYILLACFLSLLCIHYFVLRIKTSWWLDAIVGLWGWYYCVGRFKYLRARWWRFSESHRLYCAYIPIPPTYWAIRKVPREEKKLQFIMLSQINQVESCWIWKIACSHNTFWSRITLTSVLFLSFYPHFLLLLSNNEIPLLLSNMVGGIGCSSLLCLFSNNNVNILQRNKKNIVIHECGDDRNG